MDRLEEAREMVVEDPEILSGTPVIRGTRVPVHDVVAAFDAGALADEILECYPSLKEWQDRTRFGYMRVRLLLRKDQRNLLSIPGMSKW